MIELAICFMITVSLLRGFFLEGYLVSTGSMAPVLLGFHKQIRCPSCQYTFACGVRFDESTAADSSSEPGQTFATCPNCGQINIDISPVPRNHGDQLLVHKNIFDFRRPRRWEPVVFRNPDHPGEAYVKRVVGLPGEQLQIVDGDIHINGHIARKDLQTQRSMRIPVFDLGYVPDDSSWELPWNLEGNWTVEDGRLRSSCTPDEPVCTLSFRNWRWFGGSHTVETPLSREDAYPDWTDFLQRYESIPISWASRLDFDDESQVLRCRGVMPEEMQQDLMSSATNGEFRRAIYRLAAVSHLSPVTDRYGYNSVVAAKENAVADLMLEAHISVEEPPETISISIPVESSVYRIELRLPSGEVELTADDGSAPLRTGQIDPGQDALHLEASNFDHRILIAINGQLPFTPLDLPSTASGADNPPSEPTSYELQSEQDRARAAQVTAARIRHDQQLQVQVTGGRTVWTDLRVYRDVYYTPGRRKHAVDEPCEVAADSYFVHGDNSPVSSDSRLWDNPFVPHRLLMGKPFVVHLPSRPGRLRLGGREISIRIPEFSRIRYIQ